FHTLREVEPEQIGIEGWDEPGFLGMVKSCILADFGWTHKMKTLPVPIRKSRE
ncbi:MAG: hypothetical protein RLZZ226_1557, partial [Pseudomonadota bacterium]